MGEDCASNRRVNELIAETHAKGTSREDALWDAQDCCKDGVKTVKELFACEKRKRNNRLALTGCLSALFVGILCFGIGIFVGICIGKRKGNQGGGGGQYAPPPNQQPMYTQPPSQQLMYAQPPNQQLMYAQPPNQQLMYAQPPNQPPMYAPPPNQQYANQATAAQQS